MLWAGSTENYEFVRDDLFRAGERLGDAFHEAKMKPPAGEGGWLGECKERENLKGIGSCRVAIVRPGEGRGAGWGNRGNPGEQRVGKVGKGDSRFSPASTAFAVEVE